MVLILSEHKDISTNYVIDYLRFYKKKFIRINYEDNTDLLYLKITKDQVDFKIEAGSGATFYGHEVKSIWFRRGFPFTSKYQFGENKFGKEFGLKLSEFMNIEHNTTMTFILKFLSKRIKSIGNLNFYINKMDQLYAASQVGLPIPDSLVTSSLKYLQKFRKGEVKIVTKGIKDNFSKTISKQYYIYSFAERLSQEEMRLLPKRFGISLLQKEIEKKFEIRVFYFSNKFFCMAKIIQHFSEKDVDSRRLNSEDGVRYLPFSLPGEIKIKIRRLFKNLNLNSGSIDLIYGFDKNYYFLEINPVGQFGFVSYICNYNIEHEIAKCLLYE